MQTHRHFKFLADCPNWVVLCSAHVRHGAQMHWQRRENNAAMSFGHSPLNFFYSRLDWPDGNDALRDETGAGSGPLLDQPVIISLHASKLELWILEPTEHLSRETRHRRVKHRIVHA